MGAAFAIGQAHGSVEGRGRAVEAMAVGDAGLVSVVGAVRRASEECGRATVGGRRQRVEARRDAHQMDEPGGRAVVSTSSESMMYPPELCDNSLAPSPARRGGPERSL